MPSCKIMPGKLQHKFDRKYWQSFIKNYRKASPRNFKTLFSVATEKRSPLLQLTISSTFSGLQLMKFQRKPNYLLTKINNISKGEDLLNAILLIPQPEPFPWYKTVPLDHF